MTRHPPIRLDHITKRYGSVLAVDDLSFEVRAGAITGFLGPNGAGKTTTLRLLLGLAEPTLGRATILGRRYSELEYPLGTVWPYFVQGRSYDVRARFVLYGGLLFQPLNLFL